jgi:hypothetical protein
VCADVLLVAMQMYLLQESSQFLCVNQYCNAREDPAPNLKHLQGKRSNVLFCGQCALFICV